MKMLMDIQSRLELIDRDLFQLLNRLTENELRKISVTVCEYVVIKSKSSHPEVVRSLVILQNGGFGDTQTQINVRHVVEELDNVQWALQDEVDRGADVKYEQLKAFAEARAANCLYCALEEDSLIAASNTIYEAVAFSDDIDAIRSLVFNALDDSV